MSESNMPLSLIQKNIVNIVLFNAVWLVCVLGGSSVALVAVTLAIAFHMKVVSTDNRELLFISVVAVVGVVVEFSLVHFGVLKSPTSSIVPPLWLLLLWPLFATTLNHSTRWFQDHHWFAVLAGGIAGPLTYLTGTKLSNYEIVDPFYPSIAKLALVWMLVFPCVIFLAKKFRLKT